MGVGREAGHPSKDRLLLMTLYLILSRQNSKERTQRVKILQAIQKAPKKVKREVAWCKNYSKLETKMGSRLRNRPLKTLLDSGEKKRMKSSLMRRRRMKRRKMMILKQ